MYLFAVLLVALQWLGGCQDGPEDYLEVTPVEEVPFAVIVLFNNSKLFCSGTLIDVNWVLVSAHCLYNMFGVFTEHDGSITVIAGTSGLTEAEKEIASGKAQIRESEKIVVHTYYSWLKNFVNDLAVVKVKQPFKLTDRVSVATLLVKDNTTDSGDPYHCEGYGFGAVRTEKSSKHDFNLKKQKYVMTKNCQEHCLGKISSIRLPYNVLKPRNPFMCDTTTTSRICYGDNGGPLVCGGRVRGVATSLFNYDDRRRCDGLSVGPVRCGDQESVVVFTDLCHFSRWLNKVVPSLSVTDDKCVKAQRVHGPSPVGYSDF